jgi:hypothetical protein
MIPISASNGGGFISPEELAMAIGAFMLRRSGYEVGSTGLIVEEVTGEVWMFTHKGNVYRVTEVKGFDGIHPNVVRIHFDYMRAASFDKTVVRRWQTKRGKRWYELKQDDHSYTFSGEDSGGVLPVTYTRTDAINYMLKMIQTAKEVDGINYIEVANEHDPDTTDVTGYVVRVGDADDYHVEDEQTGLYNISVRLRNAGVRHIINEGDYRFTGLKTAGKDFKGNNFISLFYGRHSERHGSRDARNLTDKEIESINDLLK